MGWDYFGLLYGAYFGAWWLICALAALPVKDQEAGVKVFTGALFLGIVAAFPCATFHFCVAHLLK